MEFGSFVRMDSKRTKRRQLKPSYEIPSGLQLHLLWKLAR